MIKCFLSHSSKDKERYIRLVAEKLRKEVKIFDEETFEQGMSPAEEIIRGLDESDLFVIFLSESALNSKWVRDELKSAKKYLNDGLVQRIYPIIIEERLSFSDPRIPDWLRESGNIKHILRPTIAARKINARLIELSWKFHPRLKERESIFVGRNAIIEEIEERLDDFRRITPSVLIASGLPSIGRRTLLKYATKKSNIIRDSYDFPFIPLASSDSIEDFILKLYAHGFTESLDIQPSLHEELKKKIELATVIVNKIISENERILIEDNGVIVQPDGEIVDWFVEIINSIKNKQMLTFCIASKFRPNKALNHKNEAFYCLYVDELQPHEREGLLARYTKFKNLNLTKDEMSFFSGLLTGFPEQVIYAVDLIDDVGIFNAKKRSHEIQEYSSNKAKLILDKFSSREDVLEFIHLLSKFEFLSYDLIFSITSEDIHAPLLSELIATAICERLGSNGEYVRVNEVIKDYISRSRFGIPDKYSKDVKKHVKEYLVKSDNKNEDLSDYLFSIQQALISGDTVPDNILIPSVLIKTIRKLYDEIRNYRDALKLCDRVLQSEKTIHKNSIDHVRFIKCQCLARLPEEKKFFEEVQKIKEPEKSFLIGFYYRIAGKYEKAKDYFLTVLRNKPSHLRTKGELIQVYLQTEEYDQAFEMAKSNYIDRPANPININNYFTCLIHKERTADNRRELDLAYQRLSVDSSERAQEMAQSAKARILAFYDNNYVQAFDEIEEAINRFPNSDYPLLTKADLAVHSRNVKKLKEAISILEERATPRAQSHRSFLRFKVYLIAFEGDSASAKRFAEQNLSGLGAKAIDRFLQKIDDLPPL